MQTCCYGRIIRRSVLLTPLRRCTRTGSNTDQRSLDGGTRDVPCGSVYRSKHGTASFPWPFGRAPSPSPFVATSELRNAPSNIGRRSFRDPPQRRCSTERAPGSLAAQNDAGEEDDYEDEDVGTDEDEPASDADEDAAAPPAETVPPRGARREASSEQQTSEQGGRRVWEARPESTEGAAAFSAREQHWHKAVDDESDRRTVNESLSRICEQEREGGRMKQSQLGVLREDPESDMRLLIENYTAVSLASALREREDVLQHCATLSASGRTEDFRELAKILCPYEQRYILQRRRHQVRRLHFHPGAGFDAHNLELLRKGLNRMPRRVSTAHSKRAGVVLPLCNVDGVPCLLFEKRSPHLRAHPDEVCLPGGMVSEGGGGDKSIVETCLREMEEEIGIGNTATTVLGVLRCNWGEVHHLVGVAVTPVVCFLGEIGHSSEVGRLLRPNPSEVAECFTVPLQSFLDRDRWVHKKHYAPCFTGGPHFIWGLTGYIVNRLVMDVIERYDVVFHEDT